MRPCALSFVLALFAMLLRAEEAAPDLAAQTLVVFNPEFPQSRDLADYYAKKRGIAADHVVGLKCPMGDSMSRQEFDSLLRKPLIEKLKARNWWVMSESAGGVEAASIHVLALIRGVPFQIRRNAQNPKSTQEDEASVDSELAALGLPAQSLAGAIKNPYFDQDARFSGFHGSPGLLLVGRLDGPRPETVRRMIDDAVAVEKTGLRGRAVIDLALKEKAYKEGEDWLHNSILTFQKHGISVYVDEDEPVIPDHWPLPDTALYFGWYTANAAGAVNSPSFHFKPGAVACHLHSFSASALRSPDRQWVGPLLEKGAAVTFGNVFEPYLSLTPHFDILNKRLLEGYSVVEAAWNATPVLSWMNVVVGDPLYRPFAKDPGSSMGEGSDRDYGIYHGTAARFNFDANGGLKTSLTEMAVTRKNARLLELTALLSVSQGKRSEAIGLLEHAEALYEVPGDRLRVILYQAELYRRDAAYDDARALLKRTVSAPVFASEPALQAAMNLLKELPKPSESSTKNGS